MSVSKKLKRIKISACETKEAPKKVSVRKKKVTHEIDAVRWDISTCRSTSNIDEILELTRHVDATIRVRALRELCPCHVQSDIDEFWSRVIEMTDDPELAVRKQALHNLCDGSPKHREDEIIAAIEKYNRESDSDTRRIAHKVLGAYRKTGNWNIL